MSRRGQSHSDRSCCSYAFLFLTFGVVLNMVYIYSPYVRSAADCPKPHRRLAALPPAILDQILSHLAAADLASLFNTSAALRQHSLNHIRASQSLNIAASLPNELLQEIFSYLPPLDFYNTTRTCTTWRTAASYPRLIQKNVYLAQPPETQPPSGTLDSQLQTLAFYLQCSGHLNSDSLPRKAVSTFYCRNPPLPSKPFSKDIKPAGHYPEIHLSEDGHYFIAAETAYPFRVHVYCTYRPVLIVDIDSSWLGGNPTSFHPWDTTPTHLVTLPETGRVVSASFGKAIHDGVHFDKRTGSYSKGLDLVVLFEGGVARLYKVRTPGSVEGGGIVRRTLGGRLAGWVSGKPVEEKARWRIWDEMVFEGVCPLRQGATKVRLGERSERVFFAGAGGVEVWEGVHGVRAGTTTPVKKKGREASGWDKDAVERKLIPMVNMPGKLAGVYTGKIWDSGVGADVDYIVCSNTTHGIDQKEPNNGNPSWNLTAGTTKTISDIAYTTIITPSESFVFNYTNFVQIPGTGTPQFIALTPPHTLSHLQLHSTLNTPESPNWGTNASGHAYHKPFTLKLKSPELTHSPPSPVIHIAAINIQSISPPSLITVTATESGTIYISAPVPCRSPSCSCATRSSCPFSHAATEFRKLAHIPPATGGRITDLKVSFRGPVWASPRRFQLHSEDARAKMESGGVLVVLVATDRGRVEACYLDFSKVRVDAKGRVEDGLRRSGAGRRWDLRGEVVTSRVIGMRVR